MMRGNGNPIPAWQKQVGSVYVTFLPAALPATKRDAEQITPEVTPEVRLLMAMPYNSENVLLISGNLVTGHLIENPQKMFPGI